MMMSTDERSTGDSDNDVGSRGVSDGAERSAMSSSERRGGGRRRGLVRALLVFAAVLVGYYGLSLWQVWQTGRSDEARSVDAIVVLGAAQYDGTPSPQLAGRLDHVAELWPQGLAPMVIVTGGKQPGDRFTEAEASARYLVERGVPESAIVLENVGRSTFESLHNVAAMLDGDEGSDGAGGSASDDVTVLVVTDPYHSLRSLLIARDAGLTAFVSPTDQSVVQGWQAVRRHLLEAGGVAVGRLVGFDWL